MKPQIIIPRIVVRDIEEQADHIGRSRPETGRRFFQATRDDFERLARMPGLGSPFESDNPRLKGLRCWRVPRFKNHLIFYRPLETGIEVIRVLHGARDVQGLLEREKGPE